MSEKTTKFARWGDSDQMIPASYNEHLNLKLKYFSQMKKVLAAAILAVTTGAFIGCTKNEVKSISDNPQAVRFLPLNGKHSTKVMVDGNTYPKDLPFGTLAYYLPSGNWNANMADATLYIPISKVVNKSGAASGNAWEVEGKEYYWPKSGTLTFFAYSPFSYQEPNGGKLAIASLSGNDGIQIVDYDVDAHQDTDFMVADIAKDKTANESNGGYTSVPIVFRHKLSQIVGINFQTVITNTEGNLVEHDYSYGRSTNGPLQAGDIVFKLKKVEVRNLYTKGTYGYTDTKADPVTDHWMTLDVKKPYTWFDKETAPEAFADNKTLNLKYNTQETSNNAYLLVLPQPLITPGTTTPKITDPLIHIEYQVLTYSDATNHSTENVSEDVYLYDIHNSASASANAIDMNKKITYNFKINLENRKIYWAPSVADWDNVTYDNIIK